MNLYQFLLHPAGATIQGGLRDLPGHGGPGRQPGPCCAPATTRPAPPVLVDIRSHRPAGRRQPVAAGWWRPATWPPRSTSPAATAWPSAWSTCSSLDEGPQGARGSAGRSPPPAAASSRPGWRATCRNAAGREAGAREQHHQHRLHQPLVAGAAKIANAFSQAYLDIALDIKTDPAKRYSSWFDEQTEVRPRASSRRRPGAPDRLPAEDRRHQRRRRRHGDPAPRTSCRRSSPWCRAS
jgi:hypothetical protein